MKSTGPAGLAHRRVLINAQIAAGFVTSGPILPLKEIALTAIAD
jgi:hypothetical protein